MCFRHPSTVCMSYVQHFRLSMYFCYLFSTAAIMAFVHAWLPDTYITSTSETVVQVGQILSAAGCHGKVHGPVRVPPGSSTETILPVSVCTYSHSIVESTKKRVRIVFGNRYTPLKEVYTNSLSPLFFWMDTYSGLSFFLCYTYIRRFPFHINALVDAVRPS